MAKVNFTSDVQSISGKLCKREGVVYSVNKQTGVTTRYDRHGYTDANTVAQQAVRKLFVTKSKFANKWWKANKPSTENPKGSKDGRNLGGRPQNTYMLSVPCLEFFIARKVRPVFEVYRQVFHKVAGGGISLGNQVFQSAPMSLEDTLAPLARYNTMIEDRFEIVRGTLSHAGIEDGDVREKGSLSNILNKSRAYYHAYRDCINKLVYVETAFKLEGPEAFSLFDKE